jgi:hypothetical protein
VVVVMESAAELRAAEMPVHLKQGVWKVTVALDENGQVSLQNTGASTVLLHRVGASSAAAAKLLDAELQPDGAAMVYQALDGTSLNYQGVLLRPLGDDRSTYRLDVNIIQPATRQVYGTWGLNYSPSDSLQRGDLKIDLKSSTAQGWVNNDAVTVYEGAREVKHGDFEAQVIWQRLGDQIMTLGLCRCARFGRFSGGQVKPESIPDHAPVVLIPPP